MRRIYDDCLKWIEKYYWIEFAMLTALIGFLCFRCLGVKYIDSWDEARHGISAYEMLQSGDYLVNTYLGMPDYWNVKPPLSFLLVAAGFAFFGYTAVGLRFFSALSYLLACILAGLYARRHSRLASLLSMGFLAANYFPFKAHLARAGDADGLYFLLFTLSMLSMLKLRKSQRWLYLCGLCFSLAFLTKSFHAGAIVAVGSLFLLLTGEPKRMGAKTWAGFLSSALLPILLWAVLRWRYDGFAFFQKMYEADIVGRTALGGLEGHDFPADFYLSSIFWNFDYLYGWLSLTVVLGILYLLLRPLRKEDRPLPRQELIGILLWLFVPLLLFSLVPTKLMWYVYPCTVPLCLLSAVFIAEFLRSPGMPAWLLAAFSILILFESGHFVWQNYLDNVRGIHGNGLQDFLAEQFTREGPLAGSAIYLEAYDPFLYADTTRWEQNNRLLAMLEGRLSCQDGGVDAFLDSEEGSLLILSVPFLSDHPELLACRKLADDGQYLLLER